ncbi:hypothetical protein [Spirosoma sp.]|uniref:hypothetical protein n=1 Tax=Spirosoma sp. TaxID=1899569 RepID=UPI00260270E4|nr:hypothetical protein [Spirosoma sp.]MCX6215768.1 hypothetical protein [Spirosoma sp.]
MKTLGQEIPEQTTRKFTQLSKADIYYRTCLGTFLFLGWLFLFILGLSLEAKDFRACIMPADILNWKYLLLYAVSLTPINVAVLSSLAGSLGGIASNLAAENKFSLVDPATIQPDSADYQSYLYMTENPLVSLLRGFITYMIFIAGSYLTNFTTAIDPTNAGEFMGLTASSYTRFAVTVSLLAYLAGYDPSRIKGFLNSFNITKKENELPVVVKSDIHSRAITDTHIIASNDGAVANGRHTVKSNEG